MLSCSLFLVVFVAGNACTSKDKDDPCGPSDHITSTWGNRTELEKDQLVFDATSRLEATRRVYEWSHFVGNVCPDKHVDVIIALKVDESKRSVNVAGLVEWGALQFEQMIPMSREDDVWTGITPRGGVGLKQVYGEDPASFVSSVELSFETFGSLSADNDFVRDNVEEVSILSRFNMFKELGQNPVASQ